MTRLRSVLLFGLGFVGCAGAMLASGATDNAAAQALIAHDSRAPVDFAADAIELQTRADRVLVTGNVVVRQAGLTLTAARMTLAYSDTRGIDVNRIDALGGVTVTKGGDRASGDAAIYDLDRRIITMIGNVRLDQGANRLQGQRLVIDLGSGRASVNAPPSATPGAPTVPGVATSGGRVTGRFTVPDRR